MRSFIREKYAFIVQGENKIEIVLIYEEKKKYEECYSIIVLTN